MKTKHNPFCVDMQEILQAPSRAMKIVPLPPLPLGGPPAAAIWAVFFLLFIGGIAAAAIVSSQPKPQTPLKASLAYTNAQKYNTTSQLITTYTGASNTWTVRTRRNRFEYVWTSGALVRIVWDSVNAQCGPNLTNYNLMLNYFSLHGGRVYSNQPGYSVTLGTTQPFLNAQGFLTQFRLQLYAGDLRIEALDGSGAFWSIFPAPGSHALTGWPSAIPLGSANIVWAAIETDGSPCSTYFTQDGQLAVRTPFIGSPNSQYQWNASDSQPEGLLC